MPMPSFTIDPDGLFDLLGNVSGGEIVGNGLGGATPATVTFVSNVPKGYFVRWGTELFRMDDVVATVGSDGRVLRDGLPVQLLANDAGLSVTDLQWQVYATGMHRFWFNAPADGGTVNLSTVAEVPGIGVNGVAFSEGELVTLLGNAGSSVRAALDALYGSSADNDEIDWYANFAAFPGTGVTDRLYGARDTGDFYRWTGSAYAWASNRTTAAGITDSTAVGRAVLTAFDDTATGAERKRTVDVRDYIIPGSPLGGTNGEVVFDIAAVVAAMEAGGGECVFPDGAWVPNAFNIGLDETLVSTTPSDKPARFSYKFRGVGKNALIALPAGMTTGDYLFIANSPNTNTFLPHPKLVFEDLAVKSAITVPGGSSRSLNGGFAKINQRSFIATRVLFDKILTGFYTTGYCDLIRLEQVYGSANMTAGGWVFQGTGTGDGLVIDQLFMDDSSPAGGINLRGCLGASIRSCIGGFHQFSFANITLEQCHFEGQKTTSATPVVKIDRCVVDVLSGVYYCQKYRPSFSINDGAGPASRVTFHENVTFLQQINDTSSTRGPAKGVDVDIASLNTQSEVTFKSCKSSVQYNSTSVGLGGTGLVTQLAPLVTASGVAAIQTALTNSPLRAATDSTIRYVGSGVWEIAPTNRLPIPTKAIGATSLSGAAVTAASAFVATDGSTGTYYYKAWAIDIAGRNTAPSSEVSVTTTSGNPIAALTFNTLDAPVQLLIERGTVSGTYTRWALVTVTEMSQTIYDQGSYIAGVQWSSTSVPSVPAAGTTQSGLLHYTSGLAEIRGTAAPTTGTWLAGDRCVNTNPSVGSPAGWVCTTGGSPGTWTALNSVGTQSADTLTDGTTNKAFLATERTKLAGIATGATANSSDATLLARGNHTGTQLAATISDLLSDIPLELASGEPTMPRLNASGNVTMPNGNFRVAFFTARKTETVTQVRTVTNSQGQVGATLLRIGVYSVDASDNLTLIASTAHDATLWAAASTAYTKALSASFSKVRGTRYAIGAIEVGTSQAANLIGDISLSGAETAVLPHICAVMTGQTDLPASVAVGSLVASGTALYAVLLP
jgi:hypothetical protein